jgi:hypothetical protein
MRRAKSGETVALDAGKSSDPDGDELNFAWELYPEVGTYRGAMPELRDSGAVRASFIAPKAESEQTLHLIVTVTDAGSPPLTRYGRVVVTVEP